MRISGKPGDVEINLLYIPLGFFIGAVGTMVGAGGGFLLIPILLFLHPGAPADVITGISLAVIFLNSTSGSIAYARKKRIDWPAMRAFTIVAIPGAVLGAFATSYISRDKFNNLFGGFLILIAIYLFFKKPPKPAPPDAVSKYPQHTLIEANGTVHVLSYSPLLGQFISFATGFISSLLGIGGGIIHVPAMVRLLRFPVHIATATSHSILAVTSLCGLLVHVFTGHMTGAWIPVFCLGPGLIVGAQVGARLSDRVNGNMLLRILAVALFTVALRLLWK